MSVQLRSGELRALGTLQPGAPFAITASRGQHREVTIGVEWLELDPEVRLLVPARALDCPRQQLPGAW